MKQSDKVREITLRRAAWRQGYQLERSRARDPLDITHGKYQLRSLETDKIVFGHDGNLGRGYSVSIDEIEKWLSRTPVKIRSSHKQRAQGVRS
jgi:hypothetical protein